nr:MoeB/ThiF family adenylyltransferase [Gorillibacterium massiliense]
MSDDRYSRQIRFFGIGQEGQRQLACKHVLLIGAGALGSGNAEALARAGVGQISIVDRDYVELSNLNRQLLYSENDAELRMPKAIAAHKRLREINSDVTVHPHVLDATPFELKKLAENIDLIIDATDNFETRLAINDISQMYRIPWIYGACAGSYGISFTFLPGATPCLSCLLDSVPLSGATCDAAGIISPAVQMVVAHQSVEALKLLTGNRSALRSTLLTFDLWRNQHFEMDVTVSKKADCPSCGAHASYPYLSREYQTKTAVLCGRNTVQLRPAKRMERNLDELARHLSALDGNVECNPFLVSFSEKDHRMVFFKDGRVLVHGTSDIAEAKSLYHRLLG